MTTTSPPVTDPEAGLPAPSASAGVSPLRRLLSELTRSTAGFIGLLLVLAILAVSLIGPLIMGTSVPGDPARAWEAPSSAHWLGLEGGGKDTLHLLVTGGRTVLMVGFLAAAITTVIAVAIGSLAGYFGGRFDALMLQLTDVVMTIPQIVLLAVVGAFYKLDSPTLLAVIIGTLSWPVLMRSIRAQVLSLKEREFVEAAQLLDVGWVRIVFGEIVPNMASYILINFIIAVTNAIYAMVGLYLLGLAPQRGNNWGIMINDAWTKGAMFNPDAMPYIIAPVTMIVLLQLGLILLTRTLEEILNPRLRDR
ncbi:ABC transporter permease [Brachybacterium saurashtrense]|uniref:ABC transporter permease n=1 Tax=Brachybacterium saurashtrense TaxID=556288 RepID=A0A345YQZ3_9MICO|nr:ABC transporter permease [Brachybacterium saurashtrense]AXK46345.1 ABC transporter permease [Brachybacterium saurashtrense]RRR24085.1 ABC transporter permease [Brachybacterium saurashtrense]